MKTTRKTIKEMFHAICMDATQGRFCTDEQFVVESIGDFYYRVFIEKAYNEWINGERSSKEILGDIAQNLSGRVFNGMAVLVGRRIEYMINA